jgi:N-acetylglucosamine kinase-like BadF-type ATPase
VSGSDGVYLGVDAGNSKTVAVLATAEGRVLGYGRGGPGDIYEGEAAAVREVAAAVTRALAMASAHVGREIGDADITHAAFCLAGLDWSSDEAFWHDQVAAWLPGLPSYSLRNDGFALLRAGEPRGEGVAVSVGTGGAVVARGPGGQEWSASFWIVDAVGGKALGSEAHKAVVRAELGVGPPTALTEVVLSRHGYRDVAALLEATTRRGRRDVGHAALARDVLDAACAGDEVASVLVRAQARSVAGYAKAAARQVGLDTGGLPVVLGGSVLSSTNPTLRDATVAALASLLPTAVPRLAPRSPVVGAVAEALAAGADGLGCQALDQLSRYQFPAEFLLT